MPAGAAVTQPVPGGAVAQPVAAAAPVPPPGASSGPGFLAAHCVKCHGAQKQKGKLRVDSIAALLQGGTNGAALVPGSPDKSSILKRVRLPLSDEEHMPPVKEPQPTAAEVAALAAWIRVGAGAGGSAQPAGGAVASKSNPSSGSSGSIAGAGAGATATAAATAPDTSDSTTAAAAGSEPASAVASGANSASPSTVATGSAPSTPASSTGPVAVSGPADPTLLQSLPAEVALFADAVQPLFREKCGKCHIKDKPAGGLGVDQYAQLLEGGYSGAGVAPKSRTGSVVMQRLVLPADDGDHMPPEGEPALSADEVELVGAWIDQGAPAKGLTETAKLTAGAARALSARGVKGSGPQPLPAQAGGCAACSVPGAPQSKWLELQAVALVGGAALLTTRRRNRRTG